MSFEWKDEKDGYLAVHLPGAKEPVFLDLFESNNAYSEMVERHGNDAVALGDEWAAWLAGKGVVHKGTPVPHGIAFAIWAKASAEILAFKKKFDVGDSSPAPDSPAPTPNPSPDSTPDAPPPPTS